MSFIHLTTFIAAPQDRVFDLSRSISLHKASMNKYGEQAISGRLSGLLGLDETVTWKAKHLFKERTLEVKLTAFNRPVLFIDEQVNGDFKMMKHEHHFKSIENGTLMIDQFWYSVRHGKLGKILDAVYLQGYMKKLLEERNELIKATAEGNRWKIYISE